MYLPDLTDYEDTCRRVRFEPPEHYDFGFDLIDRRAESSDRTACVAVDAPGETVTRLTFGGLSRWMDLREEDVHRTLPEPPRR